MRCSTEVFHVKHFSSVNRVFHRRVRFPDFRTSCEHPDQDYFGTAARAYDPRKGVIQMGPPKHGQISVSEMKISHAKKHLASMVENAKQMASYHGTDPNNQTTDYGSHGTGYSSQGGFTGSGMSGGAAGADYQTTSADSVGDADSAGAAGY
jgi:hypothetical protein